MMEEHEACAADEQKSHHPESVKKNLISRLNQIERQIPEIKGMIEENMYCDDIVTQIASTQTALNNVASVLLEGHVKTCVTERIQEGDLEVIEELIVTVQKLMKK